MEFMQSEHDHTSTRAYRLIPLSHKPCGCAWCKAFILLDEIIELKAALPAISKKTPRATQYNVSTVLC